MSVVKSQQMPNGAWRFDMADTTTYFVSRFGWVFDSDLRPVPHPTVDDVMTAIVQWEMNN